MRLNALIPLTLLALCHLGCGDSTPEPQTAAGGCPPGQFCAQQALTTPTPVASTPTPAPTTTATAEATKIEASFATPIITNVAADQVKGMKAEGGAFAGQFQEGQTLEQPINLNPGKCYTVVGVSMPGVTELDIQLATQPLPPLPQMVLSQDSSSGGTAILGGKDACFKYAAPVPITGKIILKVTKGTGIAGAQLYVK